MPNIVPPENRPFLQAALAKARTALGGRFPSLFVPNSVVRHDLPETGAALLQEHEDGWEYKLANGKTDEVTPGDLRALRKYHKDLGDLIDIVEMDLKSLGFHL